MNAFQDTDENKRISLEDLVDECKTFYIATHQFLVCLDYPAFSNPSRLARRSQDIWPTKTKSRWHCKT
uniref:EF-hand domain-containing protein n=1 Tax=Populus trichocarpa TaxID=3694 RepID=B9HWW0_POPTR